MALSGRTERQTHSQRSRAVDGPVQVAATACSTGQGRNVASPAWLEKQPCRQPPGAAGTVGGAGPVAPAAVPAPSPVPLVSPAPDGAARPAISPVLDGEEDGVTEPRRHGPQPG